MLNSIYSDTIDQTKMRYNAIKNNLLGSVKIGNENVYDIFQKIDAYETEYTQNYAEQKGIGTKATISYANTEIRKFSLPIKLHASFCNPDDIIERLEEKANIREVFPYYRKNKYVGDFIINRVHQNIIDTIDDITIYAEITVDLIEYYDNSQEETYSQQTKAIKSLDVLPDVPVVQKKAVDYIKSESKNVFDKLTTKVLNTATRQATGYINSTIGGLYGI